MNSNPVLSSYVTMKESGLCLEKTTDIIEKEGILDIKDNIGNRVTIQNPL